MKQYLVGVLFFSLGIFIGFQLSSSQTSTNRGFLVREGQENFINPLLGCEISNNQEVFKEFQPIKDSLVNFLQGKTNNESISSASIYLRFLNSGRWLGINEEEKYSPASLLKVPIMMAYFHLAESDSGILKKEIFFPYNTSRNELEEIKPSEQLVQGKSYSVSDLIFRMIAYSDNDARRLLIENIDPKDLLNVYSDLSVVLPSSIASDVDFISATKYFSFFQVLYNATYLSREFSNKALEILSKTEFANGLRKETPSNLLIAHKFGERTVHITNSTEPDRKELHDCGIVYYPEHPYFLCVMTKGTDFQKEGDLMAGIAKTAYQGITDYWKNKNQ